MSNLNERFLTENSYEQLLAADYQKLMASIEHNVQEAADNLGDVSSANPITLAAIFNNFAYIGGGMYIDPSTRQSWVTEITAKISMYGWEVVWGPTWHYPGYTWDSESDACMFAAQSRDTGDIMVVVRGTNFLSMSSWLSQDFDTGVMKSMADLVPGAPANALVARGTYKGTQIVTSLYDSKSGYNISQFLTSLTTKPRNIFITGHSLGGTLVPPMFTFLNYWINRGMNGAVSTIVPISFAGLTPGNADFNSYFNTQLRGIPFYRFVNSLDIAPYCWYSKQGVLTIYDNNVSSGNGCGSVWFKPTLVIDELFSGIEGWYHEISSKVPLSGHCSAPFDTWETLALYQHHVTTYLALMVGNGEVQKMWEHQQQDALSGENC